MNDPTTEPTSSSYSMEPLLDALSGQPHGVGQEHPSPSSTAGYNDNTIIEGGLVVLRPPLSCWTANASYPRVILMHNGERGMAAAMIAFPRARHYEPGWTLQCVATQGQRVNPQQWHQFMTTVQTQLHQFVWYQVATLVTPICIMSILDVFNRMTEWYFWGLLASIFVISIPITIYQRYRFHQHMHALVQEWRHYFLEDQLLLEYQQHTVYQCLGGCIKGTESYLIWKRPIDATVTTSGPTPV